MGVCQCEAVTTRWASSMEPDCHCCCGRRYKQNRALTCLLLGDTSAFRSIANIASHGIGRDKNGSVGGWVLFYVYRKMLSSSFGSCHRWRSTPTQPSWSNTTNMVDAHCGLIWRNSKTRVSTRPGIKSSFPMFEQAQPVPHSESPFQTNPHMPTAVRPGLGMILEIGQRRTTTVCCLSRVNAHDTTRPYN